jgi:hypothetical protein
MGGSGAFARSQPVVPVSPAWSCPSRCRVVKPDATARGPWWDQSPRDEPDPLAGPTVPAGMARILGVLRMYDFLDMLVGQGVGISEAVDDPSVGRPRTVALDAAAVDLESLA